MRTLFLNLAQALGLVLLADFVAGIVHWLEDAYGDEHTPIVGPLLIKPNIVHHHYPRHFTKLSWWQSSWDLVLLCAAVLAAAWAFDLLCWQLVLFLVVAANANQVHKWSHRTAAENGPVVTFLQRIRILQTPRQHALHHTDPKNTFYCPITNLVNPVLERIRFWPRLEAVIERLTGLRHREDSSNRGAGPGPAWLADYRPLRPATAPATVSRPGPSSPAAASARACRCAACPSHGRCAQPRAAANAAAR
jgi:ubiquitin-conjugating enzyme E2 variant